MYSFNKPHPLSVCQERWMRVCCSLYYWNSGMTFSYTEHWQWPWLLSWRWLSCNSWRLTWREAVFLGWYQPDWMPWARTELPHQWSGWRCTQIQTKSVCVLKKRNNKAIIYSQMSCRCLVVYQKLVLPLLSSPLPAPEIVKRRYGSQRSRVKSLDLCCDTSLAGQPFLIKINSWHARLMMRLATQTRWPQILVVSDSVFVCMYRV